MSLKKFNVGRYGSVKLLPILFSKYFNILGSKQIYLIVRDIYITSFTKSCTICAHVLLMRMNVSVSVATEHSEWDIYSEIYNITFH